MPSSDDEPLDTKHVGRRPRSLLAGAIGADDGRCAYFYPGIDARCSGDVVAHTFMEHRGEWLKVEMCAEHIRKEDRDESGGEQQEPDRPERSFGDYFSHS